MDTTTTFNIRPATIADANSLAVFGAKTFHDTFAPYNAQEDMKLYIEKTFTAGQLELELRDPASNFLLALDGDSIVGYAKMRTSKTPEELQGTNAIEIERIYSSKEYIGKSVGKTLMHACLKIAKDRSCNMVWLGVWEHNPRAIAFYEKWGFEKFGSHAFILGTDLQTDLLMKKELTNHDDTPL